MEKEYLYKGIEMFLEAVTDITQACDYECSADIINHVGALQDIFQQCGCGSCSYVDECSHFTIMDTLIDIIRDASYITPRNVERYAESRGYDPKKFTYAVAASVTHYKTLSEKKTMESCMKYSIIKAYFEVYDIHCTELDSVKIVKTALE